MDSYFVYVLERRHVWRFVHIAADVEDGHAAIDEATDAARALGNETDRGYMAVPVDAVTIRSVRELLPPL